jgi:hypothetical protein
MNTYVLLIIGLGILNELSSNYFKMFHWSIAFKCNVYVLLHAILWFLLLLDLSKFKKNIRYLPWAYFLFCMIDMVIFLPSLAFSSTNFIIGALLYLVIFIYESFYRLKQEDYGFLQSNAYFLLASPLLFFLGMSLILGFESAALNKVVVFEGMTCYQFFGIFVNVVYYTLLNIYMYYEKRLQKNV